MQSNKKLPGSPINSSNSTIITDPLTGGSLDAKIFVGYSTKISENIPPHLRHLFVKDYLRSAPEFVEAESSYPLFPADGLSTAVATPIDYIEHKAHRLNYRVPGNTGIGTLNGLKPECITGVYTDGIWTNETVSWHQDAPKFYSLIESVDYFLKKENFRIWQEEEIPKLESVLWGSKKMCPGVQLTTNIVERDLHGNLSERPFSMSQVYLPFLGAWSPDDDGNFDIVRISEEEAIYRQQQMIAYSEEQLRVGIKRKFEEVASNKELAVMPLSFMLFEIEISISILLRFCWFVILLVRFFMWEISNKVSPFYSFFANFKFKFNFIFCFWIFIKNLKIKIILIKIFIKWYFNKFKIYFTKIFNKK